MNKLGYVDELLCNNKINSKIKKIEISYDHSKKSLSYTIDKEEYICYRLNFSL